MVDVIAWPPLTVIGYDNAPVYPVSRSRSLLDGRSYVSAAQRARRFVTITAQGIGPDRAGAGWLDMLKRELRGGVNLVRVDLASPVWHLAVNPLNGLRGSVPLVWSAGASALDWTAAAAPLSWTTGAQIAGVTAADNSLTCTGLPPSRVVAYPSELVRVIDGDGVAHFARVVGIAKSDATGTARVFLDAPLPSGDVVIGFKESLVFEIPGINDVRAAQPVGQNWSFTLDLRQVFEDETDGFTEVNPWR